QPTTRNPRNLRKPARGSQLLDVPIPGRGHSSHRSLPDMSTLDSARYLLSASLILGTTLSAQQPPLLRFQATANPGQTLQGWIAGLPLQTCATYADIGGGPRTLLGEPIWLSLSPALLQIDAGVLDASGARPLQVPTPNLAALVGQPFFLQSLVLDTAAPNG